MLSRRALVGSLLVRETVPAIDTHTHFYDPSRSQGVPWPPKSDPVLYRSVLPPEFEKLARPWGIASTVVIEASPWYEDNAWLLELASRHKVIAGVVGNLKPGTREFAKGLSEFGRNPLFRGIRINASALDQFDDLKRLAGAGLTLDVLGAGNRLADVLRLHDRVPALRIVLDHLPVEAQIETPEFGEFQGRKTVFAKVSHTLQRTGDIVIIEVDGMQRVWDIFGEDRVLYGSNWPVSEKLGTYSRVFDPPKKFFAAKGPAAERKYFSENAVRAYGLTMR